MPDDLDDAALAKRFLAAARRLPESQPAAARRGRYCSADVLVQIGAHALVVRIRNGRVEDAIDRPPPLCPWDFAIRGPADAWRKLWEPVPTPGWHDLLALYKRGVVEIEGDLHPLMANLQFVKDLMTAARQP